MFCVYKTIYTYDVYSGLGDNVDEITASCDCRCHGCNTEMVVERFNDTVLITINDEYGNASASIHLGVGTAKKLKNMLNEFIKEMDAES